MSTTKKPKDATEVQQAPEIIRRISKGKRSVMVDHYKLEVASKTVDKWSTETRKGDVQHAPDFETQEHNHFYHTYDSNGRKQTRSTSIAGHFHEITEIPQGDGLPPKILVGPAVKEARSLDPRTRKWTTKLVHADDNVGIESGGKVAVPHTHTATYKGSETIETRELNTEAAVLETFEANKAAPIPGVQG